MRKILIFSIATAAVLLSASISQAACKGGNGRGWASGKGAGKFEMSASDKGCNISFVNFINDTTKSKIPAKQVSITKPPQSGKVGVTANGLIYTPNSGFKGTDKFCTKNKASEMGAKTLSGCISVTVQ